MRGILVLHQQHRCSVRSLQATVSSLLRCANNSYRRGLFTDPFYGSPRPPVRRRAHPHVSPDGIPVPLSPPLPPLRRLALTATSAITALADPERGDMVAALGELTGSVPLSSILGAMSSDQVGARILADRPLVGADTAAAAALCGEGTFGRSYHEFLCGHGFDAEDRSPVRFLEDPDLAYVMLRYRQSHDFWHVLTGLPPTVPGEIALKWLELMQMGMPVAALSAVVGPTRLSAAERATIWSVYVPWAVRTGRSAKHLMNVYYEKEFESDLGELRQRMHIEPAPSLMF